MFQLAWSQQSVGSYFFGGLPSFLASTLLEQLPAPELKKTTLYVVRLLSADTSLTEKISICYDIHPSTFSHLRLLAADRNHSLQQLGPQLAVFHPGN